MTPLWNCRYVLHRRKSIFLQNWLEKGVWSVLHLLDHTGNILTFENFSTKYNILNKRQYKLVINAIPQTVLLMASNLYKNGVKPNIPSLLLNGNNICNSNLKNISIRNLFNKEIFTVSIPNVPILNVFSKSEIQILRSKIFKLPITPKAKEIQYKITSGIYPSADFLSKRFGFETNNCTFCNDHIETTKHVFFECMYLNAFWDDVHHWMSKYIPTPEFECENVLYGFIIKNSGHDLCINTITVLGKFFIHKNRFLKCKPNFHAFHNELCLFFSSLKHMKKKTAIKLLNIVEEARLMDNP